MAGTGPAVTALSSDTAPAPVTSAWLRAAAAYERSRELSQRTERVLAECRARREAIDQARSARWASPPRRELLRQSEAARILARLQTMPVIEQAKGVIMAQSRCGETEAFDLLRRASQRSNVPVRDLAARIVTRAAETAPDPARARGTAGRGPERTSLAAAS